MPAHRGGLRRRRDGRCGCADRSALPGQRADRRVTAGYDGPVVDAFLHTPWLGGDVPADPRGDKGRLARRPPPGARHPHLRPRTPGMLPSRVFMNHVLFGRALDFSESALPSG